MKKTVLWALVIAAMVAFSSCTFMGTATFHLTNKTDNTTFTNVDFDAISGGDDDYNAFTIEPDGGRYFYLIKPGTYDIIVTLEGGASFTAFPSFVVEKGTLYFRGIVQDDLP